MKVAELRPLTGVRGLFAWAVVLYHMRLACAWWLPAPVVAALAKGYLAVDFFFLLSGFVVWLNYGDRLAAGGGTRDFLVRRLARIWPLHAVMLGFCALLAAALMATGRPAPRFPLAELPLHLALAQDWGVANPLAWNDPAWSISAEWAAYLLLPLAAALLPRRAWPTPMLVLGAAAPLLLLWLVMRTGGETMLGADIARYGVLRCVAEFACGAVLSVLWRRGRGRRGVAAAAVTVAILCALARLGGLDETLAVPPLFAAVLLALALTAEAPRNPLSARWLHRLGEVSYATYLVHVPLFFAFKLAFVADADRLPPWQAAAVLALVLVASILLHDHVERPAQRLLLRLWTERGAPRPLVPVSPPRST
ncbi:acyltransferase family protein [Sphingomonas sp.]|uniref:acyltransferase family protein n=1 Tax=Sphingomonas sp. TaxID=28214 RepID=UPI003B0098E7